MTPSRQDDIEHGPTVPAGPAERRVVYYGPDGDGHGSLKEMVEHCHFHDKPLGHREVQVVVEYVYPWGSTNFDQEAVTE